MQITNGQPKYTLPHAFFLSFSQFFFSGCSELVVQISVTYNKMKKKKKKWFGVAKSFNIYAYA